MNLLFVHGWGFDARFWEPLAAQLPDYAHTIGDRGYFGATKDARTSGPCIVIAHSFGAMQRLADPPPECRAMLAINGFDRFAARDGKPGIPVRVLDRMIARMDKDPAAVLTDFRVRCGTSEPFGTPDVARLKADLLTLRDADCTAASAGWPVPLVSLQGAADPLLPASLHETAFSGCPDLTRDRVSDGGHLLPITHSAYCASAIRTLVERVA